MRTTPLCARARKAAPHHWSDSVEKKCPTPPAEDCTNIGAGADPRPYWQSPLPVTGVTGFPPQLTRLKEAAQASAFSNKAR